MSSGLHLIEKDVMYVTIHCLSRPDSLLTTTCVSLVGSRHRGMLVGAVPTPHLASSSHALLPNTHLFLNDLALKALLLSSLLPGVITASASPCTPAAVL
jgi:hypothetical protein